MGRLLFLFSMLVIGAVAQPWPLIRVRQAAGSGSQFTNPSAAPADGIIAVGLRSLTGKPESWQIETHLSFAGMEQFDRATRPDTYDDSSQKLVLVYRHWWSHRPDEALQALRKARYIQISIFQVGVGAEADFAKVLAARKAQLDSINLDRPDLAYQAIFGAPAGTVILLSPIASLKALDEGVSRTSAGYLRSTGTPSARVGTGPADLLQENILLQIVPHLSAVSTDFLETDPAFWTRR